MEDKKNNSRLKVGLCLAVLKRLEEKLDHNLNGDRKVFEKAVTSGQELANVLQKIPGYKERVEHLEYLAHKYGVEVDPSDPDSIADLAVQVESKESLAFDFKAINIATGRIYYTHEEYSQIHDLRKKVLGGKSKDFYRSIIYLFSPTVGELNRLSGYTPENPKKLTIEEAIEE